MTTADRLLERLAGVRKSSAPGQWVALCPAHEDRRPSLSLRELPDGRLLIHCFAGCGAASVLDALSLSFTDLFPADLPMQSEQRRPRSCVDYQALFQIAQSELLAARLVLSDAVARRSVSMESFARLEQAQERLEALWKHAHVA